MTTEILQAFIERAPKKPYATNDLQSGIRPVPQEKAFKNRYIQPNGPTHKHWISFDIDRPGGGIDWEDRNAPTPNLSIINRQNQHAHLVYLLETPVRTATNGSLKALRYAERAERGLVDLLGGDLGYSGLIIKNPLHSHWETIAWHSQGYQLDELADFVDMTRKPVNQDTYGFGRNCTVFEQLRHYAYKLGREEHPDFEGKILDRAFELNNEFGTGCLHYKEVEHIAKSIIKWVSRNFDAATFSEIQKRRNKKSVQVRRIGSAEAEKPWEALKISRRTYYNRKKNGQI